MNQYGTASGNSFSDGKEDAASPNGQVRGTEYIANLYLDSPHKAIIHYREEEGRTVISYDCSETVLFDYFVERRIPF